MSIATILPIVIKIVGLLFKWGAVSKANHKKFLSWCKQTLAGDGSEVALHDDIQRQLDELAQMNFDEIGKK